MKPNWPKITKERKEAKVKLDKIEGKNKEKEGYYKGLNLSLIDKGKTADPLVQSLLDTFAKRSNKSLLKYGVDMDEAQKPFHDWIIDTQEELWDAIVYLEKKKKLFKKIRRLSKELE